MAGLTLILALALFGALVIAARVWMNRLNDSREFPTPLGGEYRHYFFRLNRRVRSHS